MLKNKKASFIGGLIALIIILTIFITKCSQSSPLPAYGGDGEETPSPVPTSVPFDSQDYVNEEIGLTMKVPAGWQYVVKGGIPTFIHKESVSSLQIQVSEYTPYVLYVTQESLTEEIASAGGQLMEYVRASDAQYLVRYQINDMVYTEETMFDRLHVVRVVYTVSYENMFYLGDQINASLLSISWTAQTPFPSGFKVFYNQFGNFEYAVPDNWYYGVVDDTFFAQSPETEATMSISVVQTDADYSEVTQSDYMQFISSNYPSYILNSFAHDKYMVYAVGSYSNGTQRYMLIQYIIARTGFEYTITFICPYDKYNEEAELYTKTIDVFRFFD